MGMWAVYARERGLALLCVVAKRVKTSRWLTSFRFAAYLCSFLFIFSLFSFWFDLSRSGLFLFSAYFSVRFGSVLFDFSCFALLWLAMVWSDLT